MAIPMNPTDALIKAIRERLAETHVRVIERYDKQTGEVAFSLPDNELDQQDLRILCDMLSESMKALDKIADPRLIGHTEPDLYTRYGCLINVATEAKERIEGMVNGI